MVLDGKICLLPLGGYVKMYGDENEASTPNFNSLDKVSSQDKEQTFFHKKLSQKAAIVFAGPLFNYLLAIILFTLIFFTYGKRHIDPIIADIVADSPAQQAGLIKNDKVLKINNEDISDFNDIKTLYF